MVLRLPPLLGLPWERRVDGESPGGLLPFVVTGAPVSKVQGQMVQVNWTVQNSGGSSGLVELYLTNFTTATARFLRTGPLGVFAGQNLPLLLIWNTSQVAPGTYTITVGVDEVAVGGGFVRNLGNDNFTITISAPAPAPAALSVVGSPSVS